MSETLVTELLRYCKSTYGIDLCSSSGAKDVFRAELCLLKSLVCLGRSAMQSWFKQIGKGHKGQRAEKKGVQYCFQPAAVAKPCQAGLPARASL